MNPPVNALVYELELATLWFDNEGILCAIAKNTPRTLEAQKAQFDFVRNLSQHQKVCFLVDVNQAAPQDKETRAFSAQEIPKTFKALAVITNSAYGRFFSFVFGGLMKPTVPTRLFETETEARAWLRQYL